MSKSVTRSRLQKSEISVDFFGVVDPMSHLRYHFNSDSGFHLIVFLKPVGNEFERDRDRFVNRSTVIEEEFVP